MGRRSIGFVNRNNLLTGRAIRPGNLRGGVDARAPQHHL